MTEYKPTIVYVDESGDVGRLNPHYPIFVLAYCLFDKDEYIQTVTTDVQRLKFKHFGHDAVVLHEREIRQQIPPFDFRGSSEKQEAFMSDIADLIERTNFTLIAAVVRKEGLQADEDPYHTALMFGLERVYHATCGHPGTLHVIAEGRGKKEDNATELAFRRIADGDNYRGRRFPFSLRFAKKQNGHAGVEFADLLARPIGRHVMNPKQENRAWDALKGKFRTDSDGRISGRGLKIW